MFRLARSKPAPGGPNRKLRTLSTTFVSTSDDGSEDKYLRTGSVPFSVRTPAGRTFEQPGNFFLLTETSLWGTEPKFAAKGVTPDLDGDGKVEFGEAVPDADFLVAAAKDFAANARDLHGAAADWQPTPQDAFTALVVMTPTMSEYFEAWKQSRFVAGDKAKETTFVAASRLQDIAGILNGLVLIYDQVQPSIADANAQQAKQTGSDLEQLHAFATQLRDQEAGGRRFTAREADTLGSEAQDRAEAIAGQVSQAAGQLGIKLGHYTGFQYYEGRRVSRDQLEPGDLIFFHANSIGVPQHEGMYIGNGSFIHAPHTGDVVRISSLFETRYAMSYVGAVRPYAAGASSSPLPPSWTSASG